MKNKIQKMALWTAAYEIALEAGLRAQMYNLESNDTQKMANALVEAKHVAASCAKSAVRAFEQEFEPKKNA